ncbi:MAG: hypothetical protein ACT4OF_15090 [Caulobacteraceae bacterium]
MIRVLAALLFVIPLASCLAGAAIGATGAVIGAAVGVTGAVVGTTVKVTGAAVDAVIPDGDDENDGEENDDR